MDYLLSTFSPLIVKFESNNFFVNVKWIYIPLSLSLFNVFVIYFVCILSSPSPQISNVVYLLSHRTQWQFSWQDHRISETGQSSSCTLELHGTSYKPFKPREMVQQILLLPTARPCSNVWVTLESLPPAVTHSLPVSKMCEWLVKIWPKLSGWEFGGTDLVYCYFFFFYCVPQFSEVHGINFRDSWKWSLNVTDRTQVSCFTTKLSPRVQSIKKVCPWHIHILWAPFFIPLTWAGQALGCLPHLQSSSIFCSHIGQPFWSHDHMTWRQQLIGQGCSYSWQLIGGQPQGSERAAGSWVNPW